MTDAWDRVWALYDASLDLSLNAIAAETGIGAVRIWHAAWDRHRDDATRLNPKLRRRHRTLARLRARLVANPDDAGALYRARRLGFNVSRRKTGRPRLPESANAAIIEAYRAGVELQDIAVAEGLKLPALAGRVFKLQGRGVLQRRRAQPTRRQVAA